MTTGFVWVLFIAFSSLSLREKARMRGIYLSLALS